MPLRCPLHDLILSFEEMGRWRFGPLSFMSGKTYFSYFIIFSYFFFIFPRSLSMIKIRNIFSFCMLLRGLSAFEYSTEDKLDIIESSWITCQLFNVISLCLSAFKISTYDKLDIITNSWRTIQFFYDIDMSYIL